MEKSVMSIFPVMLLCCHHYICMLVYKIHKNFAGTLSSQPTNIIYKIHCSEDRLED